MPGSRSPGSPSSWAAFAVHAALFLKPGGRLGLVLPAELLSVNYAAPVRRFLFDSFRSVELLLFDEQVFPEAEADVVLPAPRASTVAPRTTPCSGRPATRRRCTRFPPGRRGPRDPSGKWSGSIVDPNAVEPLHIGHRRPVPSPTWRPGATPPWGSSPATTATSRSPERAAHLGLPRRELLRLSPPGSAHLRGLLTSAQLTRLGEEASTLPLAPRGPLSDAAEAYVQEGEDTGVDTAYKCRVRKTWYRVPLVKPADLLLTCMNADTPRLTANAARAHHLNSVHGVYLHDDLKALGAELRPSPA